MIKGILTVLLVSTMVFHDDVFASELAKKESGSKAPQSEDPPEQGPLIVVDGEHLSVTTSNDKFWAVLEEVSRRTGIKIVNLTGTKDAVISIDIQHVPIDEAIRRLVIGYDTFLFFESGDASAPALKTLWVYSRGQGRIIADLQEKVLAAEALTDKLSDPNPETRARAFEALLEKRSDNRQETALQALEDTNELVRHRTLSKALLKGVRLPAEDLRDLVFADPSELVRMEALEMIINDPTFERAEVRTIAEAATRDDSSPLVQGKAVEIIDRLYTMESLRDASELTNDAAVLDESESDTSTLAIPEASEE